MSNFDDFFAEKLDEEGRYPRREKNWKALSKRLEAFDIGAERYLVRAKSHLRYWQTTAACAIMAAVLLGWKTISTQRKYAEAQREIATLQVQRQAAENEISNLRKSRPNKQEQTSDNQTNTRGNETSSFAKTDTDNSKQPKTMILHKSQGKPIKLQPTTDEKGKAIVVFIEKESNPETPVANDAADMGAEKGIGVTIAPIDMLLANKPFRLAKSQFAHPLPSFPEIDTIATMKTVAKTLKPTRDFSRFRAGIQVLGGLPAPSKSGISPLNGHGVALEYNVLGNFWLTASADWLKFDISTEKYHPQFHPPHKPVNDPSPNPNPGPQPPKEKLVKVESTQRQQHYGLGLRYAFPTYGWVRPSVRLTHTWNRVSPETITFKFQPKAQSTPPHPPMGKPRYKVQKSDAQFLGDAWRLGAGLEHETRSWAFGLWADYSKNFTSGAPSFDMLLLKASLQYRFQ
ncbi:MAG: hypothetical protein KIS77_04650 [Saprospiraceae bacterium]|nr:hypothetical protein [Saprospiraceae bacterium]